MLKRIVFLFVLGMIIASSALAQSPPHWEVTEKSTRLTFTALYGEDEIKGAFPDFDAQIIFAPDALHKSRIKVTLPLAIFTSDDDDARSYLPEAEWLDIASFPTARFISHQITQTGKSRYLAQGTLYLKGVEKPLDLHFTVTFSADGAQATAKGKARIFRLDYGIGEGEWETDQILADQVTLKFYLTARRVRK